MPSADLIEVVTMTIQNYGIYALLPLFMIEGLYLAVAVGFLAGTGTLVWWQVGLIYMLSDFLMSCFYYWVGRGTHEAFDLIKNYFHRRSTKGSLYKFRIWLNKGFKTHYSATYFLAKLAPIPYTALIANLSSGLAEIKFQRFLRNLSWMIPLQALFFLGIGYALAQGIFFKLTPARLLMLIAAGLVSVLIFVFRHFLLRKVQLVAENGFDD